MKKEALFKSELEKFNTTQLKLAPSFAPTHPEIVELIDLYWASKYRDGDTDSLGVRKCFYNVVENPVWVALKMTDIDTKDIILLPERNGDEILVWLLNKELKVWMKQTEFGRLINDINYSWVKYGSAVVKSVKGKLELVPIQNLIIEPTAKDIKSALYVVEKHSFSPDELRDKGWENVEEVIGKKEDVRVDVFERYGKVEDSKNNYFIYANDPNGIIHILHQDKLSETPYRDLHWDKLPGRWLGSGQTEKLFEAQIHLNKIANYKSRGLHWTSKHLYQTRDVTINKNLMTDVDDGEILKVISEVMPIANEERNLHAYREEEARWDHNIDKKSFAYDVIRGERAPAGTPLGSAVLQSQMAGGFFELKREEFGMFLKQLLIDFVIPQFNKAKNAKHIFNFVGDEEELEKIDRLLARISADETALKIIAKRGGLFADEFSLIRSFERSELKKGKSRKFKIPQGLYNDLEYKIDIIITGESVDVGRKITALQVALQNTQDPNQRKRLIKKILDLMGSGGEILLDEAPADLDEMAQTQMTQAGSAPRLPAQSSAPELAPKEVTL